MLHAGRDQITTRLKIDVDIRGRSLQKMQSTRAEHWPTYFPRTCPLDCRPNRLKLPPSTEAGKFTSTTATSQSTFYLCGYVQYLLRIWAWISVKRTSHSVKGPLIAWKDREFGGQHFDMSETSRSHTFSWDESTLKSWKMLEMRFDALPTSVYESRMILIESLTIKLCAKQNRAKKTGRWAVFFYVTAPNQP